MPTPLHLLQSLTLSVPCWLVPVKFSQSNPLYQSQPLCFAFFCMHLVFCMFSVLSSVWFCFLSSVCIWISIPPPPEIGCCFHPFKEKKYVGHKLACKPVAWYHTGPFKCGSTRPCPFYSGLLRIDLAHIPSSTYIDRLW